jgi:pimeloyl-ACP methyl ester carboxylesterase
MYTRVGWFAAVVLLQLTRASQLPAQKLNDPAVHDTGTGPAYVLLSGLVGGIGGFRRIESRLVSQGYRVISIDAYRLSLDSADVSFDALARRVDRVLAQLDVSSAHVVGHAHGGGIALRLAANAPQRVTDIALVDVGAKSSARGPLLSSAIRLVPLITHIPGGRRFVRGRFIGGLRHNSGSCEWLDDSTQRAYAEPMLDNIGRVVSMAIRVSETSEPEPLDSVLARVHVPITVILGGLPHESGPDEAELHALEPLGRAVRIERIAGVAHFPHEEAPDEFIRVLLHARATTVAQAGGAR